MKQATTTTWTRSRRRHTVPTAAWAVFMWGVLVYGSYGTLIDTGWPFPAAAAATGVAGVVYAAAVVTMATLGLQIMDSQS